MDGTRFPTCRRAVPPGVSWKDAEELLSGAAGGVSSDPARLERAAALGLPPYLFDLARIEEAVAAAGAAVFRNNPASTCVNPSLSLLELEWSRLAEWFGTAAPDGNDPPAPGPERVFVWKEPATGAVRVSRAPDESLLALKIVAEELDPLEVARHGGVPVGRIDAAVDDAVDRGILLRPPSRIRREGRAFPAESWPEEFLASPVFTLQWHVTQQCDLSCLHCYDRSSRSPLSPEEGSAILRDLRAFCRERFVRGQVSFTGGNPFLYEHFETLYREAADLGLGLAILGNPVPRNRLEGVLAIRRPAYFQVSLEGLPDHNDRIRGDGNFRAVTEFLDLLRECGIFSVVMLTLTEGNVDQVLPLAELLAGKADRFAFNRLSSAGRGSDL
ncbi:MAG: selenobiotic family peptide radical SAM maturase, partial [Deltaproteobacteria bacterium]|nr:selenobiotic family peptide radical SAM maturase [Deltaproteobacteria bacterium]